GGNASGHLARARCIQGRTGCAIARLWRSVAAIAPRIVCAMRLAIFGLAVPGGMAEWLKAHAWKACIRATVSWVRIPLPPPALAPEIFSRLGARPRQAQETGRFAARDPHFVTRAPTKICVIAVLFRPFFSKGSALGTRWYGCAKCGQSMPI